MKLFNVFASGKLFALIPAVLLGGCGGGGGVDDPPPRPVEVSNVPPALVPGAAVIKFRSVGDEWAALTERLRALEDLTAPDRQLLTATLHTRAMTTIEAPQGWSLIDFAMHPSGEITLVLASNHELRLQRRAAGGALIGDSIFGDAQAATDPFIGNGGMIPDPQSLVPLGTRDAVRVTPIGEDLLLAYRTGRNAVVAQWLTHLAGGTFTRRWRTLVEPGVSIDRVRLTSGTFDPFGSLDNQWHLALDVDAQGRSAIAVSLTHTELPAGHREYFHEPVDPALFSGAIVTILDSTGLRLGATPIDIQVPSEVHAVRWAGDTVIVAGRMLTTRRDDGGGWDGFLANLKFGDPTASLQTLDFDRGDVIFDIAAFDSGLIGIVGSTGYVQNPLGGSISENADLLLAVQPAVGSPVQRLVLPGYLGHNQLRTITSWRGNWLIAGMQNGPGTHSADADPARLTCNGFLR
jgi:hypothetical protein